ncbi:SDR family NAD(P)-dependent oxidoreductase [Nocardia harenae]|uniref:SDR family NAD(P)-dependent oxidoreductase n=1 Tax=Nocardia harenae TaxID=358707 RepID=UPI000A40A0DF|nr:SDR family NAD(P)-dependent oxidoreductase [Nocardia harenae]
MTGGTSGIGAVAVSLLRGEHRVVLGARRPASGVESLPLDLASLKSVRTFAAGIRHRLGSEAIDALVLNAGVIRADADGRTVDGFETAFAVNHLAHYLLLRLLLPGLAPGAVVLLTTSGTHDPATGAGLEPPRHADARLLAHPELDESLPAKAGQHAYTASKLCAVLIVRYLATEYSNVVTPIAFDPGQVFGTGLAGDLALPMRVAWKVLGTPVGWPLRQFQPTLNSVPDAGKALASLASREVVPPEGQSYAAVRRGKLGWQEPSELARDVAAGVGLWEESARLAMPET